MKFVQTDMSYKDDSDAHAQRIMGNDVIVIPPHESKHMSRWY
jgi:hypothetical protein